MKFPQFLSQQFSVVRPDINCSTAYYHSAIRSSKYVSDLLDLRAKFVFGNLLSNAAINFHNFNSKINGFSAINAHNPLSSLAPICS